MTVASRCLLARHPAQRVANREHGFTLLELLVAVTLFAMLAVMMYGGVEFGVRAWETSTRSQRGIGDIGTIQAMLRHALSQAEPAFYRDPRQPTQTTKVAFSGGSGHIAFVAPVSQFVGVGGRYHIALELENTEAAQNLILTWEAFSVESLGFEFTGMAQKEILLHNVAGLRAAYFGRDNDTADPRWVVSWENERRLPRLIRLDVIFPLGDNRIWPEFVAPVVITKNQS